MDLYKDSFGSTNGIKSAIIKEYAVQALDIRRIVLCLHPPEILALDN
ncbi:hypothetical protein [Nostoc sp. DSM 114161]